VEEITDEVNIAAEEEVLEGADSDYEDEEFEKEWFCFYNKCGYGNVIQLGWEGKDKGLTVDQRRNPFWPI